MCFLNKVLSLAVSQPNILSTPVYLLHALGREPISIINYTQIVAFFLNHTVLVDSRVLDTSNTIWGGNLLASETLNYF